MHTSLLIIDDDEHLGIVLKRVLRHYQVTLVTTAEEGLALVRERSFDAILCDLSLPGKNGADFYDQVARIRPGQERNIGFMTGGATNDQTWLLIEENPQAVLNKPFELNHLRQFVADLVGIGAEPRSRLGA